MAENRKKELPPFIDAAQAACLDCNVDGLPANFDATTSGFDLFSQEYGWLLAVRAANGDDGLGWGVSQDEEGARKSGDAYAAWLQYDEVLKALFGDTSDSLGDIENRLAETFKGYNLDDDEPSSGGGGLGRGRGGGSRGGRSSRYYIDPSILPITSVPMGERQQLVEQAIADASKLTGVDPRLAYGMWGIESSFGKGRLSPTGCKGDWQFCRDTFVGTIKAHKNEFPPEFAEKVSQVLNGHMDLRDDPRFSTFVSMFYIKDLAKGLNVDMNDPKQWHRIYMGYNIGPGGALTLLRLAQNGSDVNAMQKLGYVAQVNPMFFKNGATPGMAVGNYDRYLMQRVADGQRLYPRAAAYGIIDRSGNVVPRANADTVTTPAAATAPASTPPVAVPAAANGAAAGQPAPTPPTAAAEKPADKPAVAEVTKAAQGITAAPPVGKVAPLGTAAANGAANNPEHKPQEPQVA